MLRLPSFLRPCCQRILGYSIFPIRLLDRPSDERLRKHLFLITRSLLIMLRTKHHHHVVRISRLRNRLSFRDAWESKIFGDLPILVANGYFLFELSKLFLHARVDITRVIVHNVVFSPVNRADNKALCSEFFISLELIECLIMMLIV